MLTFPTEKVTDHITRIYCFGTELTYLVEGKTGNILIDTGSGFGSLYGAVENVLKEDGKENLPLTVLLTHGHVDHAMGAGEFDAAGVPVYMNHEDDYIYRQHGDPEFRKAGLAMEQFDGHGTYEPEKEFMPTMDPAKIRDLKEGDFFDLGDVKITAYACPGHTAGSLVFLIEEEDGHNLLLTGDACNTWTFVYDNYSTSIEQYKESLQALSKKLTGKYDMVLLSHGDGKGYVGIVEDNIRNCEKIMEGRDDGVEVPAMGKTAYVAVKPKSFPPTGANILYSRSRIWKSCTVVS